MKSALSQSTKTDTSSLPFEMLMDELSRRTKDITQRLDIFLTRTLNGPTKVEIESINQKLESLSRTMHDGLSGLSPVAEALAGPVRSRKSSRKNSRQPADRADETHAVQGGHAVGL